MFNRILRWCSYTVLAILVVVGIHVWSAPAQAQVNCESLPYWSDTNPAINLHHVFCGEFKRGRPKGFHSRPDGIDPDTVERFYITQPANAQGIYGARWSYHDTEVTKFSSFFPDRCSMAQVQQSVVYAATHLSACPAGAPGWSKCGANQPAGGDPTSYCTADNGSPFTIAMGLFNDGRVNTAFPLRQR